MEINNNSSYRRNDPVNIPPGFRFHPTDEELVTYYLLKKAVDCNFTSLAITEVDLNKCEPWNLPSRAELGETEWYLFSTRAKKYPKGLRTNRATEAGYWKSTGKDREIYSSKTGALVGMKKTLVFYMGRAPRGEKSNWIMHEYRFEGKLAYHYSARSNFKDEWVICRVFQKNVTGVKNRQMTTIINPSSLPPLLDHSTNRESCSYDSGGTNHGKEYVPCFSMAATSSFIDSHSIFDLPPLPKDTPFPCLGAFEENLQQPVCFSAQAPPSMHRSGSAYGGCVSQWPSAGIQEMVHAQLDCMWKY